MFTPGNRNNLLLAFALSHMDAGKTYDEVEREVLARNKALEHSLPEPELQNTILAVVRKQFSKFAALKH